MAKYALGIDLGTSAVKVVVVSSTGEVVAQESSGYPLIQPQAGYNEQDPAVWVNGTYAAIKKLIQQDEISPTDIKGLSYSGQMHGLVLLNKDYQVLRPAILWNDTRTTKQCQEIMQKLPNFVDLTHNQALEGFTLPKILWVQEHEPQIWAKVAHFCLPKDYLRLKMTGKLNIDYSDATGTVMLNMAKQQWSDEILKTFHIPMQICPDLIYSTTCVGNISHQCAQQTGLDQKTKVFGGAADNAAGAVGSGIIRPGMMSTSLGTSGVVLKYESDPQVNYQGQLQCEDAAIPKTYYSMGVTLSAGESFRWFHHTFMPKASYREMDHLAMQAQVGSKGLLFAPYLVGERAPYADSQIRGSFIGIDATDKMGDFIRSVMEGVSFSFRDLLKIYEQHGAHVDSVIIIGGGAKSPIWPQIEADILDKKVVKLQSEQGPSLGAAMLVAVGLGWYSDFKQCAQQFVKFGKVYQPIAKNVAIYNKLYPVYHQIYQQTKGLNHKIF